MKLRIAIWAAAGALVVVIWRFYIAATFPAPLLGTARILIDLTCPIALIRHYPVGFYSALLVNAATYALIGAIIEFVRRNLRLSRDFRANPSN